MNRLWVRLTLAFFAVTVIGVLTIVLLVDWNAGSEFRQYVARQDMLVQNGILDDLSAFYRDSGSWNGVDQMLATWGRPGSGRGRSQMDGRPSLLLADASYQIVYDERGTRVGNALEADERANALPIEANSQPIGYLLVSGTGPGHSVLLPAEQAFLDQLRGTLLVAALVAGGVGILLGLVVSRAVAAPLGVLAHAARTFASHDWDSRAPVTGASEVAEVAQAFNDMAEELQRAETLRRNLMADIAHDLRTPLTVMQGNLRAVLDEVYPLDRSEIATLYDETRMLSRLVDDLRELALADAGQLPLNLQVVDAAPILRSTVASFAVAAEAQNIRVSLAVSDPLPAVQADPDRIAQIVRNLLSNALHHTAGGSIAVSGGVKPVDQSRNGRTVAIEVSDTGEGIPVEDLPHIFERFYRGDKSRASTNGSTGLGLAIAKAWVEAMGGQIGVESVTGQGSRFWFTLPIVPDSAPRQSSVRAVSEGLDADARAGKLAN